MDRAPDVTPDSEYGRVPSSIERVHIVFLCFGNACRSQMAEGFARARGPEWLVAESAGYYPLGYIPQLTVEVMAEKEIDLAGHRSKGLEDIDLATVSLVVDMAGVSAQLAEYDGKRVVWDIPDPFQGTAEEYRRIRDLIEVKVEELLRELGDDTSGGEPDSQPS